MVGHMFSTLNTTGAVSVRTLSTTSTMTGCRRTALTWELPQSTIIPPTTGPKRVLKSTTTTAVQTTPYQLGSLSSRAVFQSHGILILRHTLPAPLIQLSSRPHAPTSVVETADSSGRSRKLNNDSSVPIPINTLTQYPAKILLYIQTNAYQVLAAELLVCGDTCTAEPSLVGWEPPIQGQSPHDLRFTSYDMEL